MNEELLHDQLRNHWIGATSGIQLFRHVAASHGVPEVAAAVGRLADEVEGDREGLREIMRSVGAERPTLMAELSKVGVLVSRLKPNGRILGKADLSDLFDLETLRGAVLAKETNFRLLRDLCDEDPRLDPVQLDDLIQRAVDQRDELEQLHLKTGRQHLLGAA